MDWSRRTSMERLTALDEGVSSTYSGVSGVSSDFPAPLISQSAVSKMTPVNEEPPTTEDPSAIRNSLERNDTRHSFASAGSVRSSQTTLPEELLWGTSLSDSLKPSTWLRAVSAKAHSLAEYWQHFTLFGVSDHEASQAWGTPMPTCSQQSKSFACTKRSKLRRGDSVLSNMVERHAYHDEMRLQLRDERINLNYLDAFEMDTSAEGCVIRVFSLGAALLEKAKIVLAVWTFFVALSVFSFWTVLSPLHEQTELLYLDLVIDILYACALILQIRTSVLDIESGREYCSKDSILKWNVVSYRFWLDMISCIPMILLDGLFGGVTVRYFALVKILRGWRVCRTPPVYHFMPSTSFVLVKLVTTIFMGGHAFACVWFLLVFEMEKTMFHYVPQRNGFVGEYPQAVAYERCARSPGGCFYELYVVSFNAGIYLLMGIDLDAYSALEHIFVAMCAPLGGLIHAYILGRIILLIQRDGALETKQNEHTLEVQQAMRILGLSRDLQMRINAFFTYERIHRSGHSLRALFEALSPQLRFELHLHLYLDLVRKSKLFRNTRPRAIREIIMNLNDVIFLPGDWICRCGDYGDSMYFMVSGTCVVLDKDAVTEIRMLERGSYFGEVSLLTGVPRTAFVRANTFCIMAELTKDSLQPIILKWPEEIDVFISSVEDLEDRQKIKAEASRNYNLQKRLSVHGYAASSSGDEEFRSSSHSSVPPLPTSRRGSRISVSSAASSRRSSAESYFRLQDKARGLSDGQDLIPRLRHSVTLPCTLRRSTSSNMSAMQDEDASPMGRSPIAVAFGYSEESDREVKDEELSSAHVKSEDAAVSVTRHRRSVTFDTKPEESLVGSSHDDHSFEKGALPIGKRRSILGPQPSPFQRVLPESFQGIKEQSSNGVSNRDLPGLVSSDGGQMPTLLTTSPNLQAQLQGFYTDVANLQTEVFRQRELLMSSWTEMKQWTVEAVKEVVSNEVGNIVRNGIVTERRLSNYSMNSDGYGFGEADTSGGISTPFT